MKPRVFMKESLMSRLQTHEGVAEARVRLRQRNADVLADFIVSLAQQVGPVGDQVRTFIVGDDVEETVDALRERITCLEPPSDYDRRHGQGQQIGTSLELILNSIEHLLLPVDSTAAFDMLVAVFEADAVAMENCGDHDWEVSRAYERAARLMDTTAKSLPRGTVAGRLRELIANDGYGMRVALESVLTTEENR
jgi:hypothetical protein